MNTNREKLADLEAQSERDLAEIVALQAKYEDALRQAVGNARALNDLRHRLYDLADTWEDFGEVGSPAVSKAHQNCARDLCEALIEEPT